MEYKICPATLLPPDIDLKDEVCEQTFMAAWGITGNAMKVFKKISTCQFHDANLDLSL